ncbi:uncharacterized protein AMSG_03151 [Thecamonas trahens ATCC 50062]|uniref:Uncharacterized protein n=1 Tax=Thecamonas trahens ATCC 50062 TaxID=461836 RepID=A0A0L0D3H8_THETB|nr:hypothetical protein AMSG_03151 [Thecamonas trahens ATCC 50062]KNC46716.1 hypothetical protein AMSG_03151 [Thecamonas trahens ATCC 50062]|eukprot:XP_013760478.1 hypothetical protein AMSG_03151 [Thecamonas trahens ATCC 50062]
MSFFKSLPSAGAFTEVEVGAAGGGGGGGGSGYVAPQEPQLRRALPSGDQRPPAGQSIGTDSTHILIRALSEAKAKRKSQVPGASTSTSTSASAAASASAASRKRKSSLGGCGSVDGDIDDGIGGIDGIDGIDSISGDRSQVQLGLVRHGPGGADEVAGAS